MRWSFITDGNYINFRHTDETGLAIQQVRHRLHNTSRCIDWSLPEDTTRITFTIDEDKYENILISDVDFDGSVMNEQADFETNITAMFTGLAGSSPTGGSSYLVYAALLEQNGTSAPVATVLQNTLGGNVVVSRDFIGDYRFTLNGAFPLDKTYCSGFGDWNDLGNPYIPISDGATIIGYYTMIFGNVNIFSIEIKNDLFQHVDLSTLIGANGKLFLPEIRVYL